MVTTGRFGHVVVTLVTTRFPSFPWLSAIKTWGENYYRWFDNAIFCSPGDPRGEDVEGWHWVPGVALFYAPEKKITGTGDDNEKYHVTMLYIGYENKLWSLFTNQFVHCANDTNLKDVKKFKQLASKGCQLNPGCWIDTLQQKSL